MKNVFNWFIKIAIAEGVSFLVLLLIAMPLKYFAGMPIAVRIAGSIHGALFIAYVVLAILVKEQYHKNFRWMIIAFLVSIVPFGTFIMEKNWKREMLA